MENITYWEAIRDLFKTMDLFSLLIGAVMGVSLSYLIIWAEYLISWTISKIGRPKRNPITEDEIRRIVNTMKHEGRI